eukprot:COSAG04_NODE_235_length_19140_cov_47.925109_9_plen_295_part_00
MQVEAARHENGMEAWLASYGALAGEWGAWSAPPNTRALHAHRLKAGRPPSLPPPRSDLPKPRTRQIDDLCKRVGKRRAGRYRRPGRARASPHSRQAVQSTAPPGAGPPRARPGAARRSTPVARAPPRRRQCAASRWRWVASAAACPPRSAPASSPAPKPLSCVLAQTLQGVSLPLTSITAPDIRFARSASIRAGSSTTGPRQVLIRTASERIFSSCGVEIIPCVVGSRGTWRVTMSDCSSSSSRGVAWHRKTTAEARRMRGAREGKRGGGGGEGRGRTVAPSSRSRPGESSSGS